MLSGYVERKDMPGLVALVGRNDDVHAETMGTMIDVESATAFSS